MARKKTIAELKIAASKYEQKAKSAKEALEKEIRLEEERMNNRLIEAVVKYYKLQNMSTEKEDIINEIEVACNRLEEKQPATKQSKEENIPEVECEQEEDVEDDEA